MIGLKRKGNGKVSRKLTIIVFDRKIKKKDYHYYHYHYYYQEWKQEPKKDEYVGGRIILLLRSGGRKVMEGELHIPRTLLREMVVRVEI